MSEQEDARAVAQLSCRSHQASSNSFLLIEQSHIYLPISIPLSLFAPEHASGSDMRDQRPIGMRLAPISVTQLLTKSFMVQESRVYH
jgi:hypothetical protein